MLFRSYSADEALSTGLVERVVAAERLLEAAIDAARDIAANPDPQLRMIKELLTRNATEQDLGLVQRRETERLRECWKTPEHHEAVRAFLEKRPPHWRNG